MTGGNLSLVSQQEIFALLFADQMQGRESYLVPVSWENDWPIINGGNKITLRSTGPGLYQYNIPIEWRDDFSSPKLQLGWYRKSELKINIQWNNL